MANKPVILAVDDDPEVLRAIDRDLRHQYGGKFRVLRADGGAHALEILRQLQQRNEPLALMLSDHRMPQMNGVEFLEKAIVLFPNAKRVLLTAYADTDAAIRAINTVHIDFYLLKPWDPPEQNLYPVLDDLLNDWYAAFHPPFEGIRVLGHRWSSLTHETKDFLARNLVPYEWLDIETDKVSRLVEQAAWDVSVLPLVLFPDGTSLVQPTQAQIAEKLGLQTHAQRPFYDLVIVGSGPAGLAGAVYGGSEGLRTILIEREAPGGQAGTSSRIENYLGFPVGLSGADLARRAVAQARRFDVEFLVPQEVTGLRVEGPYRFVKLADGSEISCYTLLIATGVSYRKLDIPGIEKLTGAGVYYGAAMTEAFSCRDEDVFIVGGANSAGQAAIYLSRYARTVTLLVRGDSLEKGMSQYLVDQIHRTANITVRLCTSVVEVQGESSLQTITIKNSDTGITEVVPATGLFILIGALPFTDWVADILERDEQGFLLAGPDLPREGQSRIPKGWPLQREPFLHETNVPGIFVAGDVRHGSVKRVASGVGEGSITIQLVHRYLSEVR